MDNKELMFVRKAPALQYQFAIPSESKIQGRRSGRILSDTMESELELILQRTGGLVHLSQMVDVIDRYIKGDIQEMKLGQELRRLWHRGRQA